MKGLIISLLSLFFNPVGIFSAISIRYKKSLIPTDDDYVKSVLGQVISYISFAIQQILILLVSIFYYLLANFSLSPSESFEPNKECLTVAIIAFMYFFIRIIVFLLVVNSQKGKEQV